MMTAVFFISITPINNKLNGCSLEQDGEDFYIVGADAVRKKLCSGLNGTFIFTYAFGCESEFSFNNDRKYKTLSVTITDIGGTQGSDIDVYGDNQKIGTIKGKVDGGTFTGVSTGTFDIGNYNIIKISSAQTGGAGAVGLRGNYNAS